MSNAQEHPQPNAAPQADIVRMLRDPATIRTRAHRLLDLARQGELRHFTIDAGRFDAVADFVAEVIRENYPDLNIPYHGRWRHFSIKNYDRWATLARTFTDREEMVRAAIDLAVVSVLLDAGAGADWKFHERGTGLDIGRSEGLALASFYMFRDGIFSSGERQLLRADAEGLENLDAKKLAAGFQITPDNPMQGLDGRIQLVKSLAAALGAHPNLFGQAAPRPGHLYDALGKGRGEVAARDILDALLSGFASIWPGRIIIAGHNLGDVWTHRALVYPDASDGLMPFHKLSQWLTYSLLEPFEWAGVKVTGLDALTGLAEYRNGGLFLDSGLLRLRKPSDMDTPHKPADEIIVEWRALTVALLDELRVPVAGRLGVRPEDFPLARLLEGGSWWAGRKLAFKRSASGDPPLKIISDGTVF